MLTGQFYVNICSMIGMWHVHTLSVFRCTFFPVLLMYFVYALFPYTQRYSKEKRDSLQAGILSYLLMD